jgi:hemerythrin
MPVFTWNDSYSVGLTSMDNQHKKLFDLINKLYDAMGAGKGQEAVGPAIKEMLDYTKTHFTAEERILERHNYPGLAEQKKQHGIYIQKVTDFQQKAQANSLTLSFEASQFLKEWLLNHIQVIDKQYSDFLKAKGEK